MSSEMRSFSWREWLHPRDWQGRFIRKGTHVRIGGGMIGTINDLDGRNGIADVSLPDGRRARLPIDRLTVSDPPNGGTYTKYGHVVFPGDHVTDDRGNMHTVQSIDQDGNIIDTSGVTVDPSQVTQSLETPAQTPSQRDLLMSPPYADRERRIQDALEQNANLATDIQFAYPSDEVTRETLLEYRPDLLDPSLSPEDQEATIVKALRDANETVRWSAERQKVHQQILAEAWAEAADVPNEHRAIMSGGMGGAGKGTVLGGYAGIDTSQYFTIDADGMKERLAAHGLVPEVEGFAPMELVGLVHEESSYLSKILAQWAYAEGKNVIWDITMASRPSTEARIDELQKNGYSVDAEFVSIKLEQSLERAKSRWQNGQMRFVAADGDGEIGGRYVPPSFIEKSAPTEGSGLWSKNEETFMAIRERFSNWRIWDNSGTEPMLRGEGTGRGVDAGTPSEFAVTAAVSEKERDSGTADDNENDGTFDVPIDIKSRMLYGQRLPDNIDFSEVRIGTRFDDDGGVDDEEDEEDAQVG